MSSFYEDDFTQFSARTSFSRRSASRKNEATQENTRTQSRNTTTTRFQTTNQSTQGLSSNQLKSKLLESVKSKGILELMKSQLRNKLALELNPNIEQIKNKNAIVSINQKTRSNLALNTINCLFINHLKSNEYDYTLSVFMPECGINLNEVYSLTDILHVLKISNESKLYNELINSQVIKQKGLLWYLINYFCSHYVTNEKGTQTEFDGVHNIAASLDHKMKYLDQVYSNKEGKFSEKLSIEEKCLSYQRKIDEALKKEYQDKIKGFKETELAKIRHEEREKIRMESQAYRMDLEHTYQKRNESLKQREKNVDDLLQQKKEMEEREIFLQRQNLLEEIKQLREKEAAFKQTADSYLQLNKTDTSKFDRLKEELRAREAKLRVAEEDFEKRLNNEREHMKIDLDRVYEHREFLLQSIENKNKQDSQQNEIERSHLDRIKHEHQTQSLTISELELQVQKFKGEEMCLKQENELIKEKLSRCMDYDFVIQENKMLKYKLEISKEMIGEKSISKSLKKNITPRGQGNSQYSQMSGSYVPQRKRSVTFASEHGGLNDINQVTKLPIINDEASEMGADVFTDNDLNGPISLRDEGDRLLEEVLDVKEMEENLENHHVINNELKDLYEMQIYEQRKLHETINDVKKHVEFLYNGVMIDNEGLGQVKREKKEEVDVLNSSIGFIESAKDRLKFLENEGELIDQRYRDYQHDVKSTLYPIKENIEMPVKSNITINDKDIEKFLESTLKANLNTKVMREELEHDQMMHVQDISNKNVLNRHEIQSFEEIIRTVPLSEPKKSLSNSMIENQALRNQLLHDQNEFNTLKNRFHQNLTEKNFNQEKFKIKVDNRWNDDSSISKVEHKKEQTPKMEIIEDEVTLDSESTFARNLNSPAKNIGLNDYVKMIQEKKESEVRSDNIPPKKTGRIKIEYSASSSSADSSSEDSEEKKLPSYNKQLSNNEESDDDFKW